MGRKQIQIRSKVLKWITSCTGLTVEWGPTVWPGHLMDEIQVENEWAPPHTWCAQTSVLWTRLNTHSTELTAQIKEDEKKYCKFVTIDLVHLKKLIKKAKSLIPKMFICFIIVVLAFKLQVITYPNTYVENRKSHSALQNRLLSLFLPFLLLLPKAGTGKIKWLQESVPVGLY